jgi:hypothetical protein
MDAEGQGKTRSAGNIITLKKEERHWVASLGDWVSWPKSGNLPMLKLI